MRRRLKRWQEILGAGNSALQEDRRGQNPLKQQITKLTIEASLYICLQLFYFIRHRRQLSTSKIQKVSETLGTETFFFAIEL